MLTLTHIFNFEKCRFRHRYIHTTTGELKFVVGRLWLGGNFIVQGTILPFTSDILYHTSVKQCFGVVQVHIT